MVGDKKDTDFYHLKNGSFVENLVTLWRSQSAFMGENFRQEFYRNSSSSLKFLITHLLFIIIY